MQSASGITRELETGQGELADMEAPAVEERPLQASEKGSEYAENEKVQQAGPLAQDRGEAEEERAMEADQSPAQGEQNVEECAVAVGWQSKAFVSEKNTSDSISDSDSSSDAVPEKKREPNVQQHNPSERSKGKNKSSAVETGRRGQGGGEELLPDSSSASDSDKERPETDPEEVLDRDEENAGAPPLEMERQLLAFTSEGEMKPYVRHLKRIPLAELTSESDLENGYIGGELRAQSLMGLTQGHIELIVTDKSLRPLSKSVTCYVQGDITHLFPQVVGDYRVYFNRVRVDEMCIEWSQDFEMCIRVEDGARVFVVHPDARLQGFLPTKGTNTMKQKKRKRQKAKRLMKQMGMLGKGSSCPPHTEQRESTVTARSSTASPTTIASTDSPRAQTTHNQPGPSGLQASTGLSASKSQAKGPSSSLPDDPDFPDSAMADYHTGEDVNPKQSEESSSSSGEGSSEDLDDDEWRPKRKKLKVGDTGRQYEYKKIGDLTVGEKKVNIIGVVREFKPPFSTKGRDQCCFVTLVDESSPGTGIKCTIFNPIRDKLPQIQRTGDILCLHRVNVHEYNGEPSVEGVSYSSSLCWGGHPDSRLKPRTGSATFTCTSCEKERVRELQHWSSRQTVATQASCKLESVTPGCHFDLICQVIAITPARPHAHVTILTVWDGTKLPQNTWQIDHLHQLKSFTDPNLQYSNSLAHHIFLFNKAPMEAAESLTPGQYICLRGVYAQKAKIVNSNGTQEHVVKLHIKGHPSRSHVMVLNESDLAVCDLKRELEDARKKLRDINPIATTLHPDVQLTSLKGVQSCKTFPSKFKCRVKVLGISPLSVEDMVKAVCKDCGYVTPLSQNVDISEHLCPACAELELSENPSELQYIYMFKMVLEDDTGRLTAYVSGEEATRFLSGAPPGNVFKDTQLRYSLLDKLYFLTGENNPFKLHGTTRLRPWILCCLLSYQHRSSGNKTASHVCYCVFDTILKDHI